MDACYIVRRNSISVPALEAFKASLEQFHHLRSIFITTGARDSISLPQQHALAHYYRSIPLFGSPNGLCSSITESKHIKAVKEPWRRSSRYKALPQMLRTICRMEKMAALRRVFAKQGMLVGSTSSYVAGTLIANEDAGVNENKDDDADHVEEEECGPVHSCPVPSDVFSVKLAATIGEPRLRSHYRIFFTQSFFRTGISSKVGCTCRTY